MESFVPEIDSPNLFLVGSFFLGAVFLISISTWCYSWLQSFPAKPYTGHEPPLVPYYLPYLGHLFQFIKNPGDLVQQCR
jgi:oxysterol 7-alpha-hydroxylase